jgi:hypothetical protein
MDDAQIMCFSQTLGHLLGNGDGLPGGERPRIFNQPL